MRSLKIPKAILKKTPALYATDEVAGADKVAQFKIFDPSGRLTIYVVEAGPDGDDTRLFCYTVSPLGPDCDEWGYASLKELQSVRNRFGLPLERDLWFTPTKMSEIFAEL